MSYVRQRTLAAVICQVTETAKMAYWFTAPPVLDYHSDLLARHGVGYSSGNPLMAWINSDRILTYFVYFSTTPE